MFLYDRAHTARAPRHRLPGAPHPAWKFRLRSQGSFATETQTIEDGEGNYYFGSHDGCIYSVTAEGKLRWMYSTDRKIYPTPILNGQSLYLLTGTGYAISLDKDSGLLSWETRIADRPRPLGLLSDLALYLSFRGYDYDPRQKQALRAWGSPNISPDNRHLYYAARGTGLAAVDAATGKVVWRYELGGGRHSFSGPAVHSDGTIYIAAQRGWLHAVSPDGRMLWKSATHSALNSWGGVSIDESRGRLFLASSWKNAKGLVQAFDLAGKLLWTQAISGALRGGVAIALDGDVYVASGNGEIYRLCGSDGRIVCNKQVASDPGMITLWTTPVVAGEEILLSVVKNKSVGAFVVLSSALDVLHEFPCGKALSPPHVNARGEVLFGSWDGHLYCLSAG